jgi:hypothetical protein
MAARKRGREEPDLVDAPPRPDAYTGMLAIALVATVVGLVFLYLDWSDYGGKTPPNPKSLAGSSSLAAPTPAGPGLGGVGGAPGVPEPDEKAKAGATPPKAGPDAEPPK